MKTIAAIATAQGSGGIGIIRISGDCAKIIADKIFICLSKKSIINAKGYTAKYGQIIDQNEKIDEGIALIFNAPNSYTGEDVVEISCHGGLYTTKRTLRAVLNAGAIPAQAGEFTKRAFLNGKLNLTQAESVMDIIGAKGKHAAKAALSAKEGILYKKIKEVQNSLIKVAAHLSAWADYPEEDIPEIDKKQLLLEVKNQKNTISKLISNYDMGIAIKEGVETAIIGKPNVGKSTLMNLLSGVEKSIVTNIPGTTRDIIEETVLLGDIPLRLLDTAGIRETDDIIEKIGVKKTYDKIKSTDLVLALFDASEELSDQEKKMLKELTNLKTISIINKIDLKNKIDLNYIKKYSKKTVLISAKLEQGLESLKDTIYDLLGAEKFNPSEAMLANERQLNSAKESLKCINETITTINKGFTLDAITVSLEYAIEKLLELTGEKVNDAIIENVFSNFCVGK